jgi:hypothetical protein
MASSCWREELPAKLMVMKIIVAVMIGSCVMLLAALFSISMTMPAIQGTELVTYIALGFAVISIFELSFVPKIIGIMGRKAMLREIRPQDGLQGTNSKTATFEQAEAGSRLISLLQKKIISNCAILEGASMFAIIAFFLDRSPLAIVGALAMIVLLALQFPTYDRSAGWIENQLQLLKDEY